MAEYSNFNISGHARAHNGNVTNNYTYDYTVRRKRSDDTLRDDQRNTALMNAASEGQSPRVRHLVHLGIDVDHTDGHGLTALHHAALSGFSDTVEVLIDAGFDINAESSVYGTPLHLAVQKCRQAVVKLLLERRAQISRLNDILGTALHCAYYSGNEALVEILLEHGGDIDIVAKVVPAFMKAVHLRGTCEGKGLYDDPVWRCRITCLPVLMTIIANQPDAVERNIQSIKAWNRDIHKQDLRLTCAMLAVLFDSSAALYKLLAMGFDVNEQISTSSTALIMAAKCNRVGLVEMLLAHKARTEIKDTAGFSAIDYVSWESQPEIFAMLEELYNHGIESNAPPVEGHHSPSSKSPELCGNRGSAKDSSSQSNVRGSPDRRLAEAARADHRDVTWSCPDLFGLETNVSFNTTFDFLQPDTSPMIEAESTDITTSNTVAKQALPAKRKNVLSKTFQGFMTQGKGSKAPLRPEKQLAQVDENTKDLKETQGRKPTSVASSSKGKNVLSAQEAEAYVKMAAATYIQRGFR